MPPRNRAAARRPSTRRPAGGRATGDPWLSAQRSLLIAFVLILSVLFSRATLDIFNVGRFSLVLIAAIAVTVLTIGRGLVARRLVIPPRPVLVAIGAFLGAAWVTSLIAGIGATTLVGPYGRFSGVLLYTACAALFLATATAFDAVSVRRMAWACATAVGVVVAYGILQVLGADPVGWPDFEPVFSTLGQNNFAAGVTAIGFPLGLWVALDEDLVDGVRAVAVAGLVLAAWYLAEVGSFQGPVAAVAGSAVMLAVAGSDRGWWRRPSSRRWLVGAAVVALAAVVVAAPRIPDAIDDGLDERTLLWDAGWSMWTERPVVGHGFGGFADLFPRHRPDEHAVTYGLDTADAPHNVVLDMLVSGGVLLALAYLAFVAVIGWTLVSGLRRSERATRAVLAALGGGWVAYQVQSMVSIDVPPLAALHWLLAGGIVAAAGGGALLDRPLGAVPAGKGAARRVSGAAWAGLAIVVLVALAGAWFALRPLRADVAAWDAAEHTAAGQFAAAVDDLDRATDLAPWEGTYWGAKAVVLQRDGRPDEAVAVGFEAVETSPGAPQFAVTAALLAAQQGRTDEARRAFEDAIRLAPNSPETLVPASEFFRERGDHDVALELIERAIEIRPEELQYRLSLGDQLSAMGDDAGARRTYEAVIAAAPDSDQAEVAEARLDSLAD